ncbi:hypothetical protein EGI22_03945 [Lacihabitans sp. LS3-19]|uniref:hypothetical protein n=1 Tax=Lacihabitans sp. LS3-19 TaxID=2487335 RepID=UPI0020CC75B0|nr:hypothetical protein [Lacihabitans sp. LS3-19]MCP9767049.1 hypothetical protein [Lacihabitans sp. LS3-19]
MKKIILVIAVLIYLFQPNSVKAQVKFGLNINIATQPIWGPAGNDYVNYYYLPDIDIFYNVPRHKYVFVQNRKWIFSDILPYEYRNYNLYSGYKAVINEDKPYKNAAMYRTKYASYKGNHDLNNIRNSRELKYFENPDHPDHPKWAKTHPQNGNSKSKKTSKGKKIRKH